jgi:FlaA1/EpsC-like NDP-sugar epimerase
MGLNFLGFLDDDPELRGKRIAGYHILGRERDIPTIRQRYSLAEIWITFKPDELKRHRLQTVCQQQHIKLIVLTELEPFSSRSSPTAPNQVSVADSWQ